MNVARSGETMASSDARIKGEMQISNMLFYYTVPGTENHVSDG